METPDLTTAQKLGTLLAMLYPLIVLLGFDLDQEQRDALDNLMAYGAALIGGDAVIRVGRAHMLSRGGGIVVPDDVDGEGEAAHEARLER